VREASIPAAVRLTGLPEPDARRLLVSASVGRFASPAFARISLDEGSPAVLDTRR
jgi:hypothetical protein